MIRARGSFFIRAELISLVWRGARIAAADVEASRGRLGDHRGDGAATRGYRRMIGAVVRVPADGGGRAAVVGQDALHVVHRDAAELLGGQAADALQPRKRVRHAGGEIRGTGVGSANEVIAVAD